MFTCRLHYCHLVVFIPCIYKTTCWTTKGETEHPCQVGALGQPSCYIQCIGGQPCSNYPDWGIPLYIITLVDFFDPVKVDLVQVMNVAMWYNNNSHNVIHLYYTVTGTWVLYESQCLIIQCNCFAHFTIVINWNEYLC